MEQSREREPVIVLKNSSHGIALHETGPNSLYSDRIIRVGSSTTLHPNGQVDIHGTPGEEGTFSLQGHWLESEFNTISLLDPPKRPRSLQRGFWEISIFSLGGGQVHLKRNSGLELPDAEHIIVFGQILIARSYGSQTYVYHLEDVTYNASSRFRVRQIPVNNPSPTPVSP